MGAELTEQNYADDFLFIEKREQLSSKPFNWIEK